MNRQHALMTVLRCLAIVSAMAVVPAAAADWPEFRGPTGQGHARVQQVPVEWSDSQNVTWKTALPGEGWSSPVLQNGLIYLTAAVPDGGDAKKGYTLRAICLDADSGRVAWNTEVFHRASDEVANIHSKNSHASPTPLIDGSRLFVHFGHDGTACLDLKGNVLWRNDQLRYNPVHGNGGSPILAGEHLIFSADGGDQTWIIALNRQTGKVAWKMDRRSDATKKFSFSTPLLIEVDGRAQVISPGSDSVSALDPQTGKEIWRVRYDGYSVIPRPVYGRGLVFISTGYNRPVLMAIRPTGRGDVTDTHVAWTSKRAAPHTPSPLLVEDSLYIVSDNGVASCLDASTGKVHWQERLGGNYSASPIYADGKIYFQSEEGVGTIIRHSKRYEEVATNDLGERTLASYAVGDRTLYIRSASHLYRIEAR